MPNITHRKRVEACLAGQKTDRIPVALWRHFPVDDQSPDRLAAATAAFQRQYDFDLIKVTPASSFCIRAWGIEDRWQGEPEGTRGYTRRAIHTPEDWEKLSFQDPKSGFLGDQIHCLSLLVKEFSTGTPILQTIFSPLSQAKNLVGPAELPVHMRRWPDAVHAGLRRISEVTSQFIEEARKTGIDGIFYAVQHAQYGLVSEEEFEEFGRAYDLRVLDAVKGLWLNMAHLHGSQVMFDKAVDYPIQVMNWHDRQSSPSLEEALRRFPGVVCGGLRQWETMVLGTPESVREEALEAARSVHGKRFILGTGCVTPTTAPFGNLMAARRAFD